MGVAAEDQIEIGMRGLAIDLRRMRKQNGKTVRRNIGGRLLDIVDPKIMGVVDAGQINALTVAR